MTALAVYFLCGLGSFVCMVLLVRAYRASRNRLLFWSATGFGFLALNNLFLIIHMATPPEIDMVFFRVITLVIAGSVMVYGLVWDAI